MNYGVIVNENIFWSKAAFDLSSLSGDWNGFTSHGLWAWARDKYVGIRLNVSGRKYYGWLGMEYSEVNFHTLVLIEDASDNWVLSIPKVSAYNMKKWLNPE
ncbi:MAG: hypothetical protein IPH88_19365 [Bacteroidales bacterium]|nr:hypothetical protein [Bacteroidales bacterium]